MKAYRALGTEKTDDHANAHADSIHLFRPDQNMQVRYYYIHLSVQYIL